MPRNKALCFTDAKSRYKSIGSLGFILVILQMSCCLIQQCIYIFLKCIYVDIFEVFSVQAVCCFCHYTALHIISFASTSVVVPNLCHCIGVTTFIFLSQSLSNCTLKLQMVFGQILQFLTQMCHIFYWLFLYGTGSLYHCSGLASNSSILSNKPVK